MGIHALVLYFTLCLLIWLMTTKMFILVIWFVWVFLRWFLSKFLKIISMKRSHESISRFESMFLKRNWKRNYHFSMKGVVLILCGGGEVLIKLFVVDFFFCCYLLCLFHFYKNTKMQNTFTNIILHKKFMKLKEEKYIYI